MKKLFCFASLALALTACSPGGGKDEWISLFDGQSLDGWKANENPSTFSVQNGEIVVRGVRSHLFYDGPVRKRDFKNFEFKCDVLTKPGANSGVYFHTELQGPGWPAKGYEVQVNNSHGDPSRTAGLYAVRDNPQVPAKDDEWFQLHIKVEGKHVITSVNGKVIVDYTEEENPKREGMYVGRLIGSGTFALQGHDPGSEVHFKNLMVKLLP
ncbi:MAG: DUF1080 domain-containing protein [Verrucomicrobia bacterium]|nr:DUF1080 domain-containing protein [Verrucomicrobiota bacterium]